MDPESPNEQPVSHQPPTVPSVELCCPFCQGRMNVPANLAGSNASCPLCKGVFQVPMPTAAPPPSAYSGPPGSNDFVSKKLAAGLCGIFFGGWGVHKYILGFNTSGTIMLCCSVGGIIIGSCLVFPLFLTMAMHIIGIIEGIMYLSKSDQEFYQRYGMQRQEWF